MPYPIIPGVPASAGSAPVNATSPLLWQKETEWHTALYNVVVVVQRMVVVGAPSREQVSVPRATEESQPRREITYGWRNLADTCAAITDVQTLCFHIKSTVEIRSSLAAPPPAQPPATQSTACSLLSPTKSLTPWITCWRSRRARNHQGRA